MTKWAMIGLMVRRLEPPPGGKPWQRASTAARDFPNRSNFQLAATPPPSLPGDAQVNAVAISGITPMSSGPLTVPT
jgi:hypothetical protein